MSKKNNKDNKEEMITISKKEYDQLQKDSNFLAALEAAGVDNWCGYGEAYNILEEWKKEDEED